MENVSSGSTLCCYDSSLCWHALELALPSPLASGLPGKEGCVCVCARLLLTKKHKNLKRAFILSPTHALWYQMSLCPNSERMV